MVPAKPSAECLDVCLGCHFVWFDRGELAALPKSPQPVQEESMSPEAREAIALAQLETAKLKSLDRGLSEEGPDHGYEYLLSIAGLPVEHNDTPLTCRPWATWISCAVIALVSLLAFRNLNAIVANWGMVPAEFMRHWGATFVTSFFLHADAWHLIGNLYFLWVFGDNVEDILGVGRFLLLLVLAALAGDVAHIVSEPGSTIPAIGASGGISGVIAYYALRFPRAQIGFLFHFSWFYFRWLRIPVWAMFALWVAFQIWGAYAGSNSVAVFAHLGGAVVGVAFWFLTRRSSTRARQRPEADTR